MKRQSLVGREVIARNSTKPDVSKFKALVASETRSLRILRRERTQKYVTEQKRKDDTVFRDTSRLNFRQVRYIEV